ncbi:DUF1446 domain-containing protein [Sulfitobacter sp. G21635-S1]|uniref:acyclic terpene utilization AtuA family protein n=1 Tax=Sulfitobacter sp. G21635-S1 TaxID=3014043 RepID=UPI0022AFB975|nr:acyclic terpene utilization AtuA family protein [Sulfitobacter sp. G21635-S1]MCZ4256648.1 DUF1446 domain-containing protein [Sulfitobacter sp. G21635-S1]
MTTNRSIRIGAGCSIDMTLSLPQMVRKGEVDYIVIDFMTEVAVSKMKARDMAEPGRGFGIDLIGPELEREFKQMLDKGIRLVTNAGGLQPHACAEALKAMAEGLGLSPKIAVVDGDNVLPQIADGKESFDDMFTGKPVPHDLISANAYLGAWPVAQALATGADIVVTGRVVDSALIVGPLIHEFGWKMEDYDRLAGGVLIGHLLECGAQPSGGIFSDWREVDWADMSFPIADCLADGTAVFSKVAGTGGQISTGSLAEQILYEIGDPQAYAMPEVTCDFSNVQLEVLAEDQVRVWGARGQPPSGKYKVFALSDDGWQGVFSGVTTGRSAAEMAQKTGEAILSRCQTLLRDRNLGNWTAAASEVIGAGASYGAQRPKDMDTREAVFRVVMDHADRAGAELLTRVAGASLASMAPGTSNRLGAPVVSRKMRMSAFLMDAARVPARITAAGETVSVPPVLPSAPFRREMLAPNAPLPKAGDIAATVEVPLSTLAWMRSGDKGDKVNIGVIARDPDFVPHINAGLTEEAVATWFVHILADPSNPKVRKYELPGLHAFNFLIDEALDGGAVASLRFDAMGRGLAHQLADFPVLVPTALAAAMQGNAP